MAEFDDEDKTREHEFDRIVQQYYEAIEQDKPFDQTSWRRARAFDTSVSIASWERSRVAAWMRNDEPPVAILRHRQAINLFSFAPDSKSVVNELLKRAHAATSLTFDSIGSIRRLTSEETSGD